MRAKYIGIILLGSIMTACNSYNSDFMPYGLKALNVYVYDNNSDYEWYAGKVEANYFSKGEALSSCSAMAYSFAQSKGIRDWSYVCCTETSSSSCVTKVR